MKGRDIAYSAKELAFIKSRRTSPRREAHAAFVAKFGRADVSLTNYNALCKRNGWKTGRDGTFPKGITPHNKGKAHPAGRNPQCARHWFKTGERSGVAVKLYKPIGSERFSKNGYLERKTNDDFPASHRWRAVHLIRWEAINGRVPKGHALKCLDGDRLNTDPTNWTPILRALLPRLGGRYGRDYDGAPAELKPAILAIAKLEHAARSA